ncbi:cystatin [Artemisia annua]|uniref:Cystatin n=1 Tax=Artemisia annua TaxID=35608 RepID=A0A2U1L3Z1_ARTAN|nr:cystatin [Artemisia annua]
MKRVQMTDTDQWFDQDQVIVDALLEECGTYGTGICYAENGQKTVGNWLEIVSPDDPAVIQVGQFSVDEHNKDTNGTLKFERVVQGQIQIVGGINWRLTIEIKDDKLIKNCEVLVFEQPWQKVKKLIDFKTI